MLRQINTFSLYQACFTIALAAAYWALCGTASVLWPIVSTLSPLWFFLVLPALIIWNVARILVATFKQNPLTRQHAIYFVITLPSFLIFSNAISKGCFATT